jgi:hypothetical protein
MWPLNDPSHRVAQSTGPSLVPATFPYNHNIIGVTGSFMHVDQGRTGRGSKASTRNRTTVVQTVNSHIYYYIPVHDAIKIAKRINMTSLGITVQTVSTHWLRPSWRVWPAFRKRAWASLLLRPRVGCPLMDEITSPSRTPFSAALLPGFTCGKDITRTCHEKGTPWRLTVKSSNKIQGHWKALQTFLHSVH